MICYYLLATVKHFNFSWPDMTTPSMELMLNIVNIACNEISVGGKVLMYICVCLYCMTISMFLPKTLIVLYLCGVCVCM